MNIDQIAMCYMSRDLTRQALQNSLELFLISESFFELVTIFEICLCKRGGGGICAEQHTF